VLKQRNSLTQCKSQKPTDDMDLLMISTKSQYVINSVNSR